jgi:hypothetical protein
LSIVRAIFGSNSPTCRPVTLLGARAFRRALFRRQQTAERQAKRRERTHADEVAPRPAVAKTVALAAQ